MRHLSARALAPAFSIATATVLAMTIMLVHAPVHAAAHINSSAKNSRLIEFERMTWPEVKAALAEGKTTALIYTGGVEQRGPQNANGGHNQMAYATVKAIAEKLGNAIFLPVLPFTPNNANAALPGTIGITPDLLSAILERIAEQSIVNGFKNVIVMGDHGGGQPKVYEDVAKKLTDKYAAQGIHVYYCDQVYKPANDAFNDYLASKGYPPSLHGGLPDTAEMLYLDKDKTWVRRNLVPTAVGDPVVDGKSQAGPDSPHNGITGDARRSTAELGKKIFDMKVEYAVKQIQGFVAQK
jgi:creatinine amidohydrolase/Fe(II)-dependent formamide hydrolase-like protein